MEIQASSESFKRANAIAHIIRTVGVLFFIAMAFQIITWKYAMFGGVACFILAPVVRKIVGDD